MNPWGPILSDADTLALVGLSGSHAYGTNNPDSDFDYRGVFLAPTNDFLGVSTATEQYVREEPDITLFEAKKFFQLALQGNPNILEILWLPEYLHVHEVYGQAMLALRHAVLSEQVEKRYLGFANGQMHKIRNGRYGDMEDRRYKKAILHAFRLMFQLRDLKTTGRLEVRMDECAKQYCFEMTEKSPETAMEVFESTVQLVKGRDSVLPKRPDFKLVNTTLVSMRRGMI